jgi:hypothetical protein
MLVPEKIVQHGGFNAKRRGAECIYVEQGAEEKHCKLLNANSHRAHGVEFQPALNQHTRSLTRDLHRCVSRK